MSRKQGDTNLQLRYRPRPSKKDECEHRFGEVRKVGRVEFWFKCCEKCREIEWVA